MLTVILLTVSCSGGNESKQDGAPPARLLGNYEGYKAEPEIDANVYRIDGATGKATIVEELVW